MFIYYSGDIMDEFYYLVEELYKDLNNPYVGTHHYLLAYLKMYPNTAISFLDYKEHIIRVIGRCRKKSEYIIYTPKARDIKNKSKSIKEVIYYVLNDKDSIGYNLLLSFNVEPSILLNS